MFDTVAATILESFTPTKEMFSAFTHPSITTKIENMVEWNSPRTLFKSAFPVSQDEYNHSTASSKAYNAALNTLYSYLSLPNDWDGYGGKAPSYDVIFGGVRLLKQCELFSFKVPKLMLSGAGEIGFYWENGDEYAEITCDDSQTYTFIHMKNSAPYLEEDKLIERAFSTELISKVFSFNHKA